LKGDFCRLHACSAAAIGGSAPGSIAWREGIAGVSTVNSIGWR